MVELLVVIAIIGVFDRPAASGSAGSSRGGPPQQLQ
ncbi:MAG: hypothetical protein ACKOEX_08425 [Planctomycetia bacterium]